MMMKYLLVALALATTTSIFAQKNKRTKPDLTAKVCETLTCCDEPTTNLVGTDAAFMNHASSTAFGALHLAPEPFNLQNPKGTNISFACIDHAPGLAYEIKAQQPSKNFLIVIQEWWGLNDHIRQEADSFYAALDGKVNVLAIDLYDGKLATTVDSARKYIMAALQSNRKANIIKGAVAYAGADANIFSVGWCFGGMMSLQTALLANEQAKGCVMYYGTPEKDANKLKSLNCDVLGIFGTKDASIPNAVVDDFATQMKALGKNFTLERYDAPHAFANPSNPAFNANFRTDAFSKAVAFLKARL